MPRSNLVNAVDVALADPVTGVDSTIRVTNPELLPPVPFYLVIDPFGDSGREYLFATVLAVDVLTVTRNLEGSKSTNHDAGDIVRITYAAQHLSDVWDSIEAIPAPVPQTYLHADLTDVATDQHHVRYADAEAIAANPPSLHHFVQVDAPSSPQVGTVWTNPDEPPEATYLPLTGGTLTGKLDVQCQPGEFFLTGEFRDLFGLANGDSGAGVYIGKEGADFGFTGAIEATWKSTNNPTLAIGVSRDNTGRAQMVFNYLSTIDYQADTHNFWNSAGSELYLSLTAGSMNISRDSQISMRFRNAANTEGFALTKAATTHDLEIYSYAATGNVLAFDGTEWSMWGSLQLTAGSIVATGSVTGSTIYGGHMSVTGPGIAYPGADFGGGSSNSIGFRWGGGVITGVVDNAVALQVSNASDRRLKDNLQVMSDALGLIDSMPPVYSYQSKEFDGTVNSGSLLYGMVADEMEPIMPELITGDGKDRMREDDTGEMKPAPTYQSIDYLTIIPLLVQAVKELNQKVEAINA